MKKIRSLAVILAALMLLLTFTACNNETPPPAESQDTAPEQQEPSSVPDKKPEADDPSHPVHVGDLLVGERESFQFVSSTDVTELSQLVSTDTDVLRVLSMEHSSNSGLVIVYAEGVSEGDASILATSSDGSTVLSEMKITVTAEDPIYLGEGTLIRDLAVDRMSATVYEDDTEVTYTVTTSPEVDTLRFCQLEGTYQPVSIEDFIESEANTEVELVLLLDEITLRTDELPADRVTDPARGTSYTAERLVDGEEAVWTVTWDLGYTAVRFIKITASVSDATASVEQSAYARLNITYPSFPRETAFADAVEYSVKYNLTVPMLFEVDGSMGIIDFTQESDAFRGVSGDFDQKFSDPTVYGGNAVAYVTNYVPVQLWTSGTSFDAESNPQWSFNGKLVLSKYFPVYGGVYAFQYPIADETRAVIAYRNGTEIDGEKFPIAHSILEKATAVLDEIITEGMTDFEKARAIYTRMYELGTKGLVDGGYKDYDPTWDKMMTVAVVNTAYGLLNGYSGDCMGWSSTFYTLCNMAGVDCITVDVDSKSTGGAVASLSADHRINAVRLDGEIYLVDAYWSWQSVSPEDGTYRYFNMSAEAAAEYYSWLTAENGGPGAFEGDSYLTDEQTGELLG